MHKGREGINYLVLTWDGNPIYTFQNKKMADILVHRMRCVFRETACVKPFLGSLGDSTVDYFTIPYEYLDIIEIPFRIK